MGTHKKYEGAGKRRAARVPLRKRHPVVVWGLVVAILLPIMGGAAYAWNLNQKLANLDTVDTDTLKNRPDVDPDAGHSINVLLLGSDKGEGNQGGETLAEDAAASEWPSGKYRSDTIMVVHISADRSKVDLVSIPRDTYTMIYDENGEPTQEQKINAAFSEFGPLGAISTVENLTGLRMDHLAIIDWEGFKDLSTAVGGVPVTIPNSFYDPKQDVRWEAGEHVLQGDEALAYVRTRYGLLRGDYDRIARQQNFIRSLLGKMLQSGVTTNPVKLNNTVSAIAENLTIDEEWTTGDLRGLALSMRGVTTDSVRFLTAPVGSEEDHPAWGSIVRLDEAKMGQLFDAMRSDQMDAYIAQHPDDLLGDEVR
ncbi:LytR family transcriptional regulator [Aeromicrobium camelliae]|uniref:LytR family transcriptional regulator n=1 Tax=Aeromicrobium camelliae TaxID=1538144 RepID=A0A3N6WQP7_9ACTN|nr:LCP family protein [Aeromicrobium camelliae]RQN09630.1 LytR family transcriptional regulator [Aeromicrobium camelliae]